MEISSKTFPQSAPTGGAGGKFLGHWGGDPTHPDKMQLKNSGVAMLQQSVRFPPVALPMKRMVFRINGKAMMGPPVLTPVQAMVFRFLERRVQETDEGYMAALSDAMSNREVEIR